MSNFDLIGSNFKLTPVFFEYMFLSSIEEINRSISKRISYIYLNSFYYKRWRFQKCYSPSLKNLSPG